MDIDIDNTTNQKIGNLLEKGISERIEMLNLTFLPINSLISNNIIINEPTSQIISNENSRESGENGKNTNFHIDEMIDDRDKSKESSTFFFCDFTGCDKKYTRVSRLKIHVRTHVIIF